MAVRSEPGLTVAIPGEITPGTEMQRGFINDNVLHTPEYGDIHYSSYIPETYDGNNSYALFITLPGWEGLYFQGVGANMVEDFGVEAIRYNDEKNKSILRTEIIQTSTWADRHSPKMKALWAGCSENTDKTKSNMEEMIVKNVENKVIIITGASSGIGEETARVLAREGAKVVLSARREERLKKLADEIGENVGLTPDVIANAVLYAVSQPDNVAVPDLVVCPSMEG